MIPLLIGPDVPTGSPPVDQPRQCRGCRLNQIIPDLGIAENVTLWRRLEIAKRRCLFTLLSLDLPAGTARERLAGHVPELTFRFLADRDSTAHFERPLPGEVPVMTGHQQGVITINLAEADDIARTRMRVDMDEPYRTLLGHFRHETGHYYWELFQASIDDFTDRFRGLFGDESQDYAQAVQQHYARGPVAGWQQRYVSPYAAAHPWEDWAETWAHYLHILDTLQTRQEFDEQHITARRHSSATAEDGLTLPSEEDQPGAERVDFTLIMSRWVDTSIMLNSLNRSMGLPDPYPFVLNREVRRKLRFVDAVIREFRPAPGLMCLLNCPERLPLHRLSRG